MPSMFYKGLAHADYCKRATAVICLVLSCTRGKIRVFRDHAVVISEFDRACESIGAQYDIQSCVEVDWSHFLMQRAASTARSRERLLAPSVLSFELVCFLMLQSYETPNSLRLIRR